MNSILESSLRPELDALLLSGTTVYDLETWCKERGLLVSASTIKRYAEAHLPGWSGSKAKGQAVTSEAKPNKSYKVDLTDTEISAQFNQIISDNLKESMINMATIVNEKIGEYCLGESNLPKDDVAILEKIFGMFASITAKHNEDRAGKHIFDIDTALSQPKKQFEEVKSDADYFIETFRLGHEIKQLQNENDKLRKQIEEVSYE